MSASLGYFYGEIKAATPGCSVHSYSITARKSYNFSSVINSYIKSFTVIFNKNSRMFPGKAFGKTTKYALTVLKLCLELLRAGWCISVLAAQLFLFYWSHMMEVLYCSECMCKCRVLNTASCVYGRIVSAFEGQNEGLLFRTRLISCSLL